MTTDDFLRYANRIFLILGGICFFTRRIQLAWIFFIVGIVVCIIDAIRYDALCRRVGLGNYNYSSNSDTSSYSRKDYSNDKYENTTAQSFDNTPTTSRYQPPKKEIVMAVQQGSIVNAYGPNKELLVSKHGELVGYTSSTVSIYQRQNHLVQVFDVNNQLVTTHVEYR